MTKKFEEKDLRKKVARFISDKSVEITQMNHKTFVEEDISTPKVILFTKSAKGTPFVYKALSQHFEVSLSFLFKIRTFFAFLENTIIWSCQKHRGSTR